MKKYLIWILLLFSISLYGAELHITPYCADALTYAKINKINVIMWFIDDSDPTYKLRDEILLNGQLIAATEDVMWVIVDNSYEENQIISQAYNVNEFPTIMCMDRDANELYGSRFSYSLVSQNVLISHALLMSLVANNVIDWEVGDNWYDDRYVYNNLETVEYTYWNNKPCYDYDSDYYREDTYSETKSDGTSYNSVNILAALLFLYQLYPALSPITSGSVTRYNKVIRTYYSYREPPQRVIRRNIDPRNDPRRIVFSGYDKNRPNNRIRTIDEFEREYHTVAKTNIFSRLERELIERRPLFDKEKKPSSRVERKDDIFYKPNSNDHIFDKVDRGTIRTNPERVIEEKKDKRSSQVIVRDRRETDPRVYNWGRNDDKKDNNRDEKNNNNWGRQDKKDDRNNNLGRSDNRNNNDKNNNRNNNLGRRDNNSVEKRDNKPKVERQDNKPKEQKVEKRDNKPKEQKVEKEDNSKKTDNSSKRVERKK